MNYFLLAMGGAIGAIARYLIGLALVKKSPISFIPIAMLSVNLLGSLGLGVFYGQFYGEIPRGTYTDPFFLVFGLGFFGAFTTFSSFSVEAAMLYQQKQWKKLYLYVGLSIFGSITCFLCSFLILSS
ncbi:fluoride efflux transporter CrcB [Bacillus suaedae]|uniref:Fluoride-specific ion channel FluC n=1 Tax=Halalkalibacter suaedae TaxID=2822140 RepID=A0A941ALW9_9BACI|nr:fluoride efflux transporter CrcB [Bacillus suaedae]MBP3949855.1 fluoride efflux transporter CrcB [Bacillus suaedae]